DMERVHAHVHGVIAAIAPHDSVERFTGLGVKVIPSTGQFIGPRELLAGATRIRARRFVIATGSRPRIPAISGLATTPFFTNETLFANREPLPHLLILGGGPIGLEMAQSHRRLGSQVTVVEQATLLPREEPELVATLRDALLAEGVALHVGATVQQVEHAASGITLLTQTSTGEKVRITGTHLLVATGRSPNLEDINLDAAGVAFTPAGITVDDRLRTSNHRIFALGDVTGPYLFTHMASYQAGIVLRNALFRLPARVDYRVVPRITYTDPELAQVGLTEKAARERGGPIRVLTKPFAENDRARAEGKTMGLIKVVTGRRGHILGAGLVGPQAGELLAPWILAIQKGLRIGDMAGCLLPYPTLGEIGKGVAGSYFTQTLFSNKTRGLVKLLAMFG
ncbi:MAG: FAD-dependent oxidoreductase, partial [Magnetococcales bacterium]|nr:FAD-dependent oxidoreductase [Magnetococcales bacterium]